MEQTLQDISDSIGECIQEYYSDIGALSGLKIRFRDNDNISQWVDYFIRIDKASIEELGAERDEHEKRLSDLRRARQDRAGDGNGNKIPERAGEYVDASVWNPQSRPPHGRL